MGKLLKQIGRGILKGAKDVLPVATREMKRAVNDEAALLPDKERVAYMLSEMLTVKGTQIILLVYLIDQIFKLGLF